MSTDWQATFEDGRRAAPAGPPAMAPRPAGQGAPGPDWQATRDGALAAHLTAQFAPLAVVADPPIPAPPLNVMLTAPGTPAAAPGPSVGTAQPVIVPAALTPGLGAGYDDATAINWALATFGRATLLPCVYALYTPVVMLPYTRLAGAQARLTGAGATYPPTGGYTILQPQSTFTSYNAGGSIGTLPGALIAFDAAVNGTSAVEWAVDDLVVDGKNAPAGLPGYGIYGNAAGHRFGRCTAQGMPGAGWVWTGSVNGLGNPDGGHLAQCLAQNCGDFGFKATPEDSTFYDCHAQGCDSGWYIAGNNSYFSQCRADTSTNKNGTGGDGYYIQSHSAAGHDQPVTLVGCGSETNYGNGVHVFDNPVSLTNPAVSVILSGHVSQGDGVNGGAGGGSFSGMLCEGNSTRLYIGSAIINTSSANATTPCPQYGLTARATSNGNPFAVKMFAGRVVGNTASSNNEPPITNFLVASGVDTT